MTSRSTIRAKAVSTSTKLALDINEDESTHSHGTYEIEPQDDGTVRLTVTHEDLEHDLQMLSGISTVWPKVLSNLKTCLERGQPSAGAA